MDFDTFIGQCDLGDFTDPYIVINDFLKDYFPDVDLNKIEYLYDVDELSWGIEPLNEYTRKIFYKDLKLLEREEKIKKLLHGI